MKYFLNSIIESVPLSSSLGDQRGPLFVAQQVVNIWLVVLIVIYIVRLFSLETCYAPAIRKMVEGHKVLPLSVCPSMHSCLANNS